MAVTNQAQNLVSVANFTNDVFSSRSITWADANYTWAEGGGTWENPYSIGNVTQNLVATSGITNQSVT